MRADRFLNRVEDYWIDTLVAKTTGEAIRQMARKLYPGAANATLNRQCIVPAQAIINYAADLERCARIRVKRFKTIYTICSVVPVYVRDRSTT